MNTVLYTCAEYDPFFENTYIKSMNNTKKDIKLIKFSIEKKSILDRFKSSHTHYKSEDFSKASNVCILVKNRKITGRLKKIINYISTKTLVFVYIYNSNKVSLVLKDQNIVYFETMENSFDLILMFKLYDCYIDYYNSNS